MRWQMAVHHLVGRIEKALNCGRKALALFLDVEGAFSHASFKTLSESTRRVGVDITLCRWIDFMLAHRTVEASIGNCKVAKQVERGCPQAGMLSPLLWNFIMDDL